MQYMNFRGPNFTLETPTDWVISSTPQLQAIFLAPNQHPIRPNLAVSLRPVEEQVTVQAVAESAEVNQEREYPQFTVIEEIDFTETGGNGFLRRYRWFNATHKTSVDQSQAFFLYQRILYTLTATRPTELEPAESNDLDAIFDHMIRSFRIG